MHEASDPDRLSDDDARILSLESSSITGHTLKLNVLTPGPPLDLEALRSVVMERLPREPRARQRVDTSGPAPRWVTAEDFDVREHVRRLPIPEGGSPADLWRVVSRLVSEHLDRRRPLWTFDVIGPLGDASEAVAVRLHHTMADGLAGVRFLDALLWDRHGTPAAAASAGTAADGPAHPHGWWAEAGRAPRAVFRELGHPGLRSPFDRPITGSRELAFTAVPLGELTAVGAARPDPATVNDVLLAVVAGGLREWLTEARPAAFRLGGHLNAQVPVSLRHAGHGAELGNLDSFLNVGLPLAEPDPVRRLDRIRAQTRRGKAAADAQELHDVFTALGRFRHLGPAVQRLANSSREFGVAVSNVPGPREPVGIAGRRLRHLFTSAEPAEHHALRISAISCVGEPVSAGVGGHEAQLGIGLCTDPGALTGLSDLARAMERSHLELVAATR